MSIYIEVILQDQFSCLNKYPIAFIFIYILYFYTNLNILHN
jgi:hypothetical protein